MLSPTLRLFGLLLFGLVPLFALGEDGDDASAAAGVTWLTDLDLATSIAAERDRPLMIVFR